MSRASSDAVRSSMVSTFGAAPAQEAQGRFLAAALLPAVGSTRMRLLLLDAAAGFAGARLEGMVERGAAGG